MPTITQILIGVAVIVILTTHQRILYYLRRLLFKPDVQKLMDARDIPGLLHALYYKGENDDYNSIRSNAAIALGNVGNISQLDALVDQLEASDEIMVEAAIQAIGQITLRCVRQPMFEAYQGEDNLRIQSLLSTLQNIQARVSSPLINAAQDTSQRKRAAQALGIISGSEAFAFLRRLIKKTDDAETRNIAVQAILSTGDPKIVEAFINFLNVKKTGLQIAAAEVLGNLREKRAVNPLGKLLTAGNSNVRKSAAEALGKIGDPQAVEQVITLLSDKIPMCRKTAAAVLAQLGDEKWAQWIKGDRDDFNRLATSGEPSAFDIISKTPDIGMVIPALGALGDTRAVKFLIEKLDDKNEDTRKDAAIALGKLSDTNAVDALKQLIADKSASVRVAAAEALDKLGHSEWTQWIKGNKNDFHRLTRSKDPMVFELLLKMKQDADTIMALGTMGDKRAVEPLIQQLDTDDDKIQLAAINALGHLRDKRAIQPLIKKLESIDSDMVLAVLKVLESWADKTAVPQIRKLLVSPGSLLRTKSAAALAKLGEPKWLDIINGQDDDFKALLYEDDEYIASQSIAQVMGGLYSSSYNERKETAAELIKLAKKPPPVFKNFWKKIRKEIETPHDDSHYDHMPNRTSDCVHQDSHTDSGIGMSFPRLPNQFK